MTNNTSPADDKKVKRIAIYTRKSNDDNLATNVTSLDAQKSCCRSYINIQKANRWEEYPEVFDDAAESGRSLKRPAMQRLLKCVEEDKIDGVIVYKLDRITRNSKDFHYLLELFEKHDVAFISATESIDTKSPQGRLMTAIMVQFAQYDREMDQERSKDFHLARAKKGLWCGGVPPLGYDSKDKLLVVNEEEADLVRRIFNLYLEHQSAQVVSQELGRLGFKRKTHKTLDGKVFGGSRFDKKNVIRILQRKVYIGLVRNERTKQDFPGQQQPIVAPAIFERAQELLKSHSQREGPSNYKPNKYGFRLKGLVRCGECHSAVVAYIRPKPKTGKIYQYYRCQARANGVPGGCSVTSIGAQKLEEFIIEKLAAVGWSRPLLEKVVENVKRLSGEHLADLEKEKRKLENQLATTRHEMEKMVGLIRIHPANKELHDEMDKLDATKQTLEVTVCDLAAQISFRKEAVYDVGAVQGIFQHFAKFIYRLPVEQQINAIHLLVKQVLLFKDKVKVELHELPISDLQKALDGEIAKGGVEQFASLRSRTTGGKKLHLNGTAVVEVPDKWRGPHPPKDKTLFASFIGKTCLMPAFEFTLGLFWEIGIDGEKFISCVPVGA